MRKIIAFAIVALLGSNAFAAGVVYRWKDANGIWHYSDQPQPGAELVRGPTRPVDTPALPAAPAVPRPAAESDNALPVSAEVAQQVRQDAAASKAQTCEKAKVDYQQKVQALRIYKTDAQGNRTYMNDAELDAARLQARAARDLACGS